MDLLIIWIGSVLVTKVMDYCNSLKIFKDLADRGYKINIRAASKFKDKFETEESNNKINMDLIPIVNLAYALKKVVLYNTNKETFMTQLDVLGLIDEMYDLEKEQYAKNTTVMNAYKINMESYDRFEEKVMIDTDYGKAEVIYEADSDGKITVLNASGTASRLSKDEIKSKIKDEWRNYNNGIIEKINRQKEELINIREEVQEYKSLFNEDKKLSTNTNKVLKKK